MPFYRETVHKVVLERALSKLGIASRKETLRWILEERLSVNGKIIKDPMKLVTPEKDIFALDGKKLHAAKPILLLFHKPKGYITTRKDEKGRKTFYDLLPLTYQHLHSVGRLDMHTTGLLLLTSDTQLSSYLTDPNNAIPRVYILSVKGKVTEEEVTLLETGIQDEGELLKAKKLILRKVSNRESHLIITLLEGKNREIRRLFLAIGHEVLTLKRISFGPWELGDLEPGHWKEVSPSIS